MISDVTKIQIKNKNIAANGITDVVLQNLGSDAAVLFLELTSNKLVQHL